MLYSQKTFGEFWEKQAAQIMANERADVKITP